MGSKRKTSKANVRHEAALKAVETRRANEAARKRSAAARKAWRTRRNNAR